MSAQPAPQKFTFDTVFDAGGGVMANAPRPRKAIPVGEVEAMVAAAREDGAQSAQAKAADAAASAARDAANALAALVQALGEESAALKRDAVNLGLASGRMLAGQALEQFETDAVMGFLEACAQDLRAAPRVRVLVNADVRDAVAAGLSNAAERLGLAEAITVEAAPAGAPGAVSIDWGDGGAAREPDALNARLDAEAARWLAAAPAQGDLFHQSEG